METKKLQVVEQPFISSSNYCSSQAEFGRATCFQFSETPPSNRIEILGNDTPKVSVEISVSINSLFKKKYMCIPSPSAI